MFMPGKFAIFFVLFLLSCLVTQPVVAQVQAEMKEEDQAQLDPIERSLWYNAEKTAKIKIYKAVDGRFYGKVVWLKVPERDGKPKMDSQNPDKSRQNDPILGLLLLKKLKKTGDNSYEDGTIYNPVNGKTYSCILTYKGDKVELRGFIGFSFIGHSTTWTKAD
jgi:uncharacterized protein (DUF2147 family)